MRFIAIIVLLFYIVAPGFAQYCTPPSSTTAITPTSAPQTTATFPAGTAPVFTFTATAGCTYTFTTCGLSTVDTYLRIYNANLTLVQGWDDQCGLQTNAVWTAPSSGAFSIQLSQFVCGPLIGSASMTYSVSCPTPPCTNPVVNAGNDIIICAGATGQLSGTVTPGTGSTGGSGGTMVVTISGSGWLDMVGWSFTNAAGSVVGSGGTYALGSTNNITIASPGAGPYSFYLETLGTICDNTANYTITCNGTIVASGSVGPCLSTTVPVASCTGSISPAPITYVWSPATALSSTTILNPTASPTTTTTYTLTATQGTCSSQDQVTVYVNPLPTVNAGPDVALCSGQSGTTLNGTASATGGFTGDITVNVFSGSNLDETTWTMTNSTGAVIASGGPYAAGSNNTITISNPTNAPYTFNLETQGPSNSNVAGYNILCGGINGTSISGGIAILTGGQTIALPIAGCAGTITPTVTWSPATGLSSTNTLTTTANPSSTTTYTLTATANGCTNQDQVTVTVGSPPTVSVNSTTICAGQTATLTATPGTAGGTYLWSPGGQTTNAINVSPSSTTNYSVVYTLNGCSSASSTGTVTVTPGPTISVPPITFCPGASVTLSATASPSGGIFAWTPGGQTTSSITVNPSTTTTYNVSYTVPGCPAGTATATATLANTLDWANIQWPGTSTICQGQTLNIYGQVFESGLTNPSGQAAGITVSYGLSTSNTNPATWPASAWTTASFNPLASVNPNNDEYMGTLSGLSPGTYYYAFSYTYNGCTVYGGYNASGGGFWDGITNVNGTVTVAANTTPNFTAVSAICAGTNLSPLPTTSTNNISGTWSPALNNSQTTTYTFTPNAGVCATNSTMTITVNTLPVAGITNNSNTTVLTCTQTSISLTGTGGGNYSWSNGSSVVGTSTNLTVINPGIYTLTVTNASGCSATSSLNISQNTTAPIVGISSSATQLTCTNTSVTLSATGGGTYSWSNGTTVVGTGSSLTITSPGTYTVTVTGANGCTATASSLITQNLTPPAASITNNTGSNILNCNTTSISLSATGGQSYSWSNGTTNLGTNASLSLSTPGSYTVTVTGANGCISTSSMSITQNLTLPIVNITSSNSNIINCNIPSLTLTASGGQTYEWESNGTVLGTSASLIVNTQGQYTVTVIGANGCSTTGDYTITANNNPPTASISSNVPSNTLTCTTTSVTLTASGNGTYSWTQGATNLGSSATLTVNNPGTYTLTVTGANGCTATSSIVISQNTQVPTVAITSSPQTNVLTCSTTSLTLTATGGQAYSWSNGSTNIGNSATLLVTTPGTYTVTVTGANGCTATSSSTITQDLTAPTVTISNSAGANILNCTTTSLILTANGGSGSIYSWSNGSTFMGNGAALLVTNPGTYTVLVTGANGCTATSSITITQTIAAPTVSISNATNATVLTCALTSITLNANGGGTYSWSNGSSIVSTSSTLSVSSPGTYTVTVTGTNGCSATATTTITQNITAPTAVITNNPNTTTLSCTSNSLSLTATGGNGYSWIGGGANLGTNPSITVTTAGTYTVTVTGSNGCTATASTTISQNTQAPTVSVIATANGVLTCSNTSITLTGSSSTGSGTATWLNGTTVISNGPISGIGNVANLVVTAPGTYTLNILEANGCIGTTNYTVTQNITAPTAVITNNTAATLLTCSQTSINVLASGASTYSWSNGTNVTGTNAALNITNPGTYTVTASGSNGCVDTEQITITQDITAPNAAITNNTGASQLTCALTSISLTATGGGTYSWSNGSSTIGTNANLIVTTPGTYTVTVTNPINGCTNTSSITITQNITPPSVSISTLPNTTVLTCTNTSIALTASGGSAYTWISLGNNLGNNSNITVTTPGTYSVSVTGANGCTASVNTTITQNTTAPTAAITNLPATNVLTCSTTTINLTATGGVSYSWSNGTTIVGTNATLAVTTPGTYTVTVTGSNGCTSTANTVITQNITAPVAAITNNSNTTILTCTQTSIAVVGSGGVSYSWSNGTTNVGNLASLSITIPGTYTVTATAANGCTDTEVITITQNITAPTAAITNTTNTTVLDCNTTSIALTAGGGGSYTWSNGTANLGSTAALQVTTAGTYTVTVTAANGCIDTEVLSITYQANTNPTFTPIAAICTGGSINLPITSNNGVNGSWSPAPNLNATTTYTFTPNTGLCANTSTMTVTVNPYPSITAVNDTICAGSTGTITTQINLVGGTYTWVGSANTLANLSASPSNTNSYTVIYNLAGCTDTAFAQIIVNPVPVVQVQNTTICAGQTGQLVASANLPNGSYLWSNGNTNNTISLNPLSTTSQSVTYTLAGCTSAPVTATLTVNPVPSISMNNQAICLGDPVTMQAVANPAGTYYWGPNAVQGIASNTFTPAQDSTIQVFNILNGCSSDTIQATVNVLPLPISTFSADVLQGCVPLSVNFSADVSNNTSYNWQTSNQLNATGAQANLEFDMNGSFTVSLTATLNGCTSTTSISNMIVVDNYPIAAFEPSSQVFTEPNQSLSFWNSSVGATSYVWNFGDGGSSIDEAPTHLFEVENEGTTVVLYAYSNLGCADTTAFFIGFDPGLVYYIPNSFTPDGDQFNQTFLPIFTSGIDPYNYQLLIYNRWGEIIFESLHPEIGWDGSYGTQGNPAQNGTYTYLITIKVPSIDKRQTIKGHVNLIR